MLLITIFSDLVASLKVKIVTETKQVPSENTEGEISIRIIKPHLSGTRKLIAAFSKLGPNVPPSVRADLMSKFITLSRSSQLSSGKIPPFNNHFSLLSPLRMNANCKWAASVLFLNVFIENISKPGSNVDITALQLSCRLQSSQHLVEEEIDSPWLKYFSSTVEGATFPIELKDGDQQAFLIKFSVDSDAPSDVFDRIASFAECQTETSSYRSRDHEPSLFHKIPLDSSPRSQGSEYRASIQGYDSSDILVPEQLTKEPTRALPKHATVFANEAGIRQAARLEAAILKSSALVEKNVEDSWLKVKPRRVVHETIRLNSERADKEKIREKSGEVEIADVLLETPSSSLNIDREVTKPRKFTRVPSTAHQKIPVATTESPSSTVLSCTAIVSSRRAICVLLTLIWKTEEIESPISSQLILTCPFPSN